MLKSISKVTGNQWSETRMSVRVSLSGVKMLLRALWRWGKRKAWITFSMLARYYFDFRCICQFSETEMPSLAYQRWGYYEGQAWFRNSDKKCCHSSKIQLLSLNKLFLILLKRNGSFGIGLYLSPLKNSTNSVSLRHCDLLLFVIGILVLCSQCGKHFESEFKWLHTWSKVH